MKSLKDKLTNSDLLFDALMCEEALSNSYLKLSEITSDTNLNSKINSLISSQMKATNDVLSELKKNDYIKSFDVSEKDCNDVMNYIKEHYDN